MKTIPNKLNQNFIKMKKRFIKNHQKTKRRYDHANKVQILNTLCFVWFVGS